MPSALVRAAVLLAAIGLATATAASGQEVADPAPVQVDQGPTGPGFHFGATAGVVFTLRDSSSSDTGLIDTGTGYQVPVFAEYDAQKWIGGRVELSFSSAAAETDPHLFDGRRRVSSGMADVLFLMALRDRPYLFAGAGAAEVNDRANGSNVGGPFQTKRSQTVTAYRFGAGVLLRMSPKLAAILEVRYTGSTSGASGPIPSRLSLLSLLAGVRF